MTRDGVKQGREAARSNEVQQRATRSPGKVTLTSKLSPGRAPSVQRRVMH